MNNGIDAGGRFRGWGAVEAFVVAGVVASIAFSLSAIDIAKQLSMDPGRLGGLGGSFFVAFALGQIGLGALFGRVPARWLLASTAVLAGIGSLIFASAGTPAVALAGQVILGLGFSTSFVGVIHIVGRDFPAGFSLMAGLSQGLANIVAALVAFAAAGTAAMTSFRVSFSAIGVGLFVIAGAIAVLVRDETSGRPGRRAPEDATTLATAVGISLAAPSFWLALVFYGGLFGAMIGYTDLWSMEFERRFFAHTKEQSAIFNGIILIGFAAGGILAGLWARGRGDFVLPARVCGFVALAGFLAMTLAVYPVWAALLIDLAIGIGLGGAVLGLAALRAHLPEAALPVATSIVVTAGLCAGGLIQPVIGRRIETPAGDIGLFGLLRAPSFVSYQDGVLVLIGAAGAAFAASLLFRPRTRG